MVNATIKKKINWIEQTMASNKKYFRTLEEFNNPSLTEQLAAKEFADEIPVEELLKNKEQMDSTSTNRRDFLKLLGFSTAAVTIASCEGPVIKSIPYAIKPEEITPGVPTFYASTMFDGYDYSHVIVKTREGRPIKIDKQKDAPYFGEGGARMQASVLSLYDNDRVKTPMLKKGKTLEATDWETLDKQLLAKLASAKKEIVILSRSIPSPTTQKLITDFQAKYANAKHVVYDPVGSCEALDAAEESFGKRVLPHYDLSNVKLIVSFNADFLNDWNAGGMIGDYAKARKPGKDMLRHVQVESNLSITGSNADDRHPMKPSKVAKVLEDVYGILSGATAQTEEGKVLAAELKMYGKNAVVFADGSKEHYNLAYAINSLLGSQSLSGKAIYLRQYNQKSFDEFLVSAKAGNVSVLLNADTNPFYAYENQDLLKQAFDKIEYKVSMSQKIDETSTNSDAIAPTPHWLESWGDYKPMSGVYGLQQPLIKKIFDTRQFQDSLLKWSSQDASTTFYDYLKSNWETSMLSSFGVSFNKVLYDGFAATEDSENLTFANVNKSSVKPISIKNGDFELQLYTKVGMGDGTQANNPWLQEFPDPVTRTSWDNYASMHAKDAEKLGIDTKWGQNDYDGRMSFNGAYINVTLGNKTVKVPVFVQPGQAEGSIGIALGYGRTMGGKVCNEVGVNVFPLFENGIKSVGAVKVELLDEDLHPFANMQVQNTLLGRYELARDVNLSDFINKPSDEWNEKAEMGTHKGASTPVNQVDLWQPFDRSFGPHFNLSIDLNSCTGCGACVVACQAENNVPVVGKDEIRRSRDMYWLRIDRYYSNVLPEDLKAKLPKGDGQFDNKLTQKEAIHDGLNEPQMYKLLRKPAEDNPDVIFQPVMCQHCNHAPCETVCPVAATSHGRQGQNQMAYNRCVGTRYCANNCPYKVRRFNWFNYTLNDKFDYHMNNDLGRMVLNPDVAVRVRGVMEKCSLCIQKTQKAISNAKAEGRDTNDKDFETACSMACDTGSIQFGNINDKTSVVSELLKEKRKYVLLEEVGTKPNVMYHVKVRNTKRKI